MNANPSCGQAERGTTSQSSSDPALDLTLYPNIDVCNITHRLTLPPTTSIFYCPSALSLKHVSARFKNLETRKVGRETIHVFKRPRQPFFRSAYVDHRCRSPWCRFCSVCLRTGSREWEGNGFPSEYFAIQAEVRWPEGSPASHKRTPGGFSQSSSRRPSDG
jgi:hypothetical protein